MHSTRQFVAVLGIAIDRIPSTLAFEMLDEYCLEEVRPDCKNALDRAHSATLSIGRTHCEHGIEIGRRAFEPDRGWEPFPGSVEPHRVGVGNRVPTALSQPFETGAEIFTIENDSFVLKNIPALHPIEDECILDHHAVAQLVEFSSIIRQCGLRGGWSLEISSRYRWFSRKERYMASGRAGPM